MGDPTPTYDLPSDIVEKLLCLHCNTYLSCGPVELHPDGAITCGRCSHPDEECNPQLLFEVAMANFMFPCRYKLQGCTKRVLFNHAVEHEIECPYRAVCCPALPYNSCLKGVSVFDIYDHFNETHVDLILKDGKFKLEFEQDVQCNFLMSEDGVIVVVQYIYHSVKKMLHLDVRHFSQDDGKVVNYKLQIMGGCDSGSMVNLKERQCDHYESHALNLQSAANLVLDNYLPILENPGFVYVKVKLMVNTKRFLQTGAENNSSPIVVTSELQSDDAYEEKALTAWNEMENIRCHFCNIFAIPPVYISKSNKCICRECKDKFTGCSFSERKIEIKTYPCLWRGCTYMGNDSTIKKHIENCQFKTVICPLSSLCEEGYYKLNNLMEHMQSHGTYCPNPQRIVVDLFCVGSNNFERKVYFTFFENRVIAFICDIYEKYLWNLSGTAETLNIDVHFEHDHCRIKSKTSTYADTIDVSYTSAHVEFFPKCFESCRRISAVLKIYKSINA